jgi:hypothetical protein
LSFSLKISFFFKLNYTKDSAEIILNTSLNQGGANSNEIAMTKKQCKIYTDQMKTLSQQQDLNSLDTNKVTFQLSKLIEIQNLARFSNRILIINSVYNHVSLASVGGSFGDSTIF